MHYRFRGQNVMVIVHWLLEMVSGSYLWDINVSQTHLFLWHQQSKEPHSDHFVRRLSVRLSRLAFVGTTCVLRNTGFKFKNRYTRLYKCSFIRFFIWKCSIFQPVLVWNTIVMCTQIFVLNPAIWPKFSCKGSKEKLKTGYPFTSLSYIPKGDNKGPSYLNQSQDPQMSLLPYQGKCSLSFSWHLKVHRHRPIRE